MRRQSCLRSSRTMSCVWTADQRYFGCEPGGCGAFAHRDGACGCGADDFGAWRNCRGDAWRERSGAGGGCAAGRPYGAGGGRAAGAGAAQSDRQCAEFFAAGRTDFFACAGDRRVVEIAVEDEGPAFGRAIWSMCSTGFIPSGRLGRVLGSIPGWGCRSAADCRGAARAYQRRKPARCCGCRAGARALWCVCRGRRFERVVVQLFLRFAS